jgi:hypothetical protein
MLQYNIPQNRSRQYLRLKSESPWSMVSALGPGSIKENKNTRNLGEAPVSLSYSSIIFSKSSCVETEIRESKPSSGNWYLNKNGEEREYASQSLETSVARCELRGRDIMRVSPPAYLNAPSLGRGRMRPPRLQRSFTGRESLLSGVEAPPPDVAILYGMKG